MLTARRSASTRFLFRGAASLEVGQVPLEAEAPVSVAAARAVVAWVARGAVPSSINPVSVAAARAVVAWVARGAAAGISNSVAAARAAVTWVARGAAVTITDSRVTRYLDTPHGRRSAPRRFLFRALASMEVGQVPLESEPPVSAAAARAAVSWVARSASAAISTGARVVQAGRAEIVLQARSARAKVGADPADRRRRSTIHRKRVGSPELPMRAKLEGAVLVLPDAPAPRRRRRR